MKNVRENLFFLAKSQGNFCQKIHINPVVWHSLASLNITPMMSNMPPHHTHLKWVGHLGHLVCYKEYIEQMHSINNYRILLHICNPNICSPPLQI